MINVTKRDGRIVPFNIESLRTAIAWATDGLDANPLELEAVMQLRLVEGISTVDIQENLINGATSLASPSAPDWRYVAGRLQMWTYKKQTMLDRGFGELYVQAVDHLTYGKWYSEELKNNYDQSELEIAASWIDPDRDRDYDLAGVTTLVRKYLLPGELPQEAFLTVALLIASVEELGNRLKVAREVYDAISLRKISLATPILANLRVPNGNLSSCFIIGVNDSLESIFDNLKNAARISKNGGGVGINLSHIRAKGSWVNRRENASKGITSWSKLFNDTAVSVDQNGKRAGAFTLSLDIWHLDVLDFLELQTETGDQRSKAYDIFPQLVIPDLFMQKVLQRKTWVLFDPYEVKEKYNIDLAKSWGGHFEQQYTFLVEQFNNQQLKLAKIIDANALFKQIMRTQLETGLPYLAFKDTINRANPNKHLGYIPGVNLCVSPETKVLTSEGYKEIQSLAGGEHLLWNGEQWSKSKVFKTGEGQNLIKVTLSNGVDIDCTEYHKFWVHRNKPVKIDAKDLAPGDKLIKYELPVIMGDSENHFPYAYTHGAYCGDGSLASNKYPEVVLYGQKKGLLPFIEVRNKHYGNKSVQGVDRGALAVYDDIKQDRLVCKLPLDLPSKFTVPNATHSLESRLSWLAGLLDTDGHVQSTGSNQSLVISGVNKEFLLEVRLLLHTLGVDSKVSKMYDEGFRLMPDGRGGYKEYLCQQSYRLLITSSGLYDLLNLGLTLNRIKVNLRKPQLKSSRFVKVVSVKDEGRISDTFCFTEPIRNMGMFNGVLLGNCVEAFANVAPDKEAHTCNLNSLNMANIGDYELEAMSKLAVRILDNLIDMTTTPIKESQTHNNLYRTIGVGVMGLADYLAKNEKTYRDLDFIGAFAEKFNYYTTLGSVELALERGAYGAFTGSEWDGGLLANSKSLSWFLDHSYSDEMSYKWVKLHGMIEKYGIRNSHIQAIAPNTTSSLLQGCTASVLPAFGKFYYDKSSKGSVPIAPPFIGDKWWYYQENKTMDQKVVIEALAKLQQYVDTGISSELMFNLNEGMFNGGTLTAKDIYDRLILAWKLGLKTIYYIRSVTKQDLEKKEYGCTSCTN